jgi:hypothetical protein
LFEFPELFSDRLFPTRPLLAATLLLDMPFEAELSALPAGQFRATAP